jgi:excisionase family DNA binding protein
MTNKANRPLTIRQTAQQLNMRLRAVRRLIEGGQLKASRHGRGWQVEPEDLRQFQEQRASKVLPTPRFASSHLSCNPNQRQKDVQFWNKWFKRALLICIFASYICLVGVPLLSAVGRTSWFGIDPILFTIAAIATLLYIVQIFWSAIAHTFLKLLNRLGIPKNRILIFVSVAIFIALIFIINYLSIGLGLRLSSSYSSPTAQTSSISTAAPTDWFGRTSTPTFWPTSSSIVTSAPDSSQP